MCNLSPNWGAGANTPPERTTGAPAGAYLRRANGDAFRLVIVGSIYTYNTDIISIMHCIM
jgi:hypothetical protein